MNEFVYYMRSKNGDGQLRPSVTVALVGENGKFHRGVSICSFKDNPQILTGRNKATGRAIKAMVAQRDVLPIERDEARRILSSSWGPKGSFMTGTLLVSEYNRNHKGAYDVTLCPIEMEMMTGKKIEERR